MLFRKGLVPSRDRVIPDWGFAKAPRERATMDRSAQAPYEDGGTPSRSMSRRTGGSRIPYREKEGPEGCGRPRAPELLAYAAYRMAIDANPVQR